MKTLDRVLLWFGLVRAKVPKERPYIPNTVMEYNSNDKTGIPLYKFCDIQRLRGIAGSLWGLLDDIDTASDMWKPKNEEGYKAFYEYAMRRVARRFDNVNSDGYELFVREIDHGS